MQTRDVTAKCESCGRVLDVLTIVNGIDEKPEVWPSLKYRPGVPSVSRLHIRRASFKIGVPLGSAHLGWRCKCGRDIQRNRQRLVPAFLAAARAGVDLRL
jgi:hypothetical protein